MEKRNQERKGERKCENGRRGQEPNMHKKNIRRKEIKGRLD